MGPLSDLDRVAGGVCSADQQASALSVRHTRPTPARRQTAAPTPKRAPLEACANVSERCACAPPMSIKCGSFAHLSAVGAQGRCQRWLTISRSFRVSRGFSLFQPGMVIKRAVVGDVDLVPAVQHLSAHRADHEMLERRVGIDTLAKLPNRGRRFSCVCHGNLTPAAGLCSLRRTFGPETKASSKGCS